MGCRRHYNGSPPQLVPMPPARGGGHGHGESMRPRNCSPCRHRRANFWCVLVLGMLFSLSSAFAQTNTGGAQTAPAAAAAPTGSPNKFISPDDGWLDVSGFMDTKFGFMPIGTVITEPAVGVGFAGGLAFVSQPPA